MHTSRPICLSIAGLDPCGGAGLLADIKTFEQNQVLGFGIASAITFQNDNAFEGLNWISPGDIIKQLSPLRKYEIQIAKIGIIQDIETLHQLTQKLFEYFPDIELVWDPVLQASAGFQFHEKIKLDTNLLNAFTLITPNDNEYKILELEKFPNSSVLLKGGHREDKGTDILFIGGEKIEIKGLPFESGVGKHGTGCVLSSAISANLAKGLPIIDSCRQAKTYVENFIQSNPSNLGYHS